MPMLIIVAHHCGCLFREKGSSVNNFICFPAVCLLFELSLNYFREFKATAFSHQGEKFKDLRRTHAYLSQARCFENFMSFI